MARYLACDLGAESGRVMSAEVTPEGIRLEEVHRFGNVPVVVDGSLCWDMEGLWEGMREGLRKAGAGGGSCAGISADSWGVDYILFDGRVAPMLPAYHYRDERTARGVARVRERLTWPEVFAETGIQFMPLNTVYQLAAEAPERLERAALVLGVGDAFNHRLGGRACVDESMASTFQLYNPMQRQWSERMIEALGFPRGLFPEIVPCGTEVGRLSDAVRADTGLPEMPVIASCSHDTGAAVAAVPAEGEDWAYISSGTWSLMGVERERPVLGELCRERNFTNEIGFGGTVRLLKNIAGLWLAQESRRAWEAEGRRYDYGELTARASAAVPFRSLVRVSDPRFVSPGDLPGRIAEYCRETGQPVPRDPGETIRCVLESLALEYRRTLEQLEEVGGRRIRKVHIVGGGSKNELLSQFTADALGLTVVSGPAEATALGNVAVQAIATGRFGGLGEARSAIEAGSALRVFEPRGGGGWDAARERYRVLAAE